MEEIMRFPPQNIRRTLALAIGIMGAALTVNGCAHSASSLTPSPSAGTSSHTVRPSAKTAYPATLGAYPATLGAYPASAGAFPASLSAFPVCQTQSSGTAMCKSAYRTSLSAIPATVNPQQLPGYAPVHLQSIYGLTSQSASLGSGATVAIVSAFVDANLANDLATYRAMFGLPACTVASGCLTITNAGNRLADVGWATETDADAEAVSAICPNCKIVVVQAKSAKIADLAAAVDQAATYNPAAISNSFATTEVGAVSYASHWSKSGMAIVAAAGDGGYAGGPQFPASVPTVVAIGGASVQQNSDGTFATPTVWAGTGSGCSAYFAKPTWQLDSGCSNRTVNDITALADPATGMAAYSTQAGGWVVVGGTSIAAPMVSAMYALAGTTSGMLTGADLYDHPDNIKYGLAGVTGSNGTCSIAYLCTASTSNYDGPTGNGFPYGLQAFSYTAPENGDSFSLTLLQ
jgi:subtilase family serine protease